MEHSMFAIDTSQDNKKVKYARDSKKKEKIAQGITKVKFRLIWLGVPLIILGLPD